MEMLTKELELIELDVMKRQLEIKIFWATQYAWSLGVGYRSQLVKTPCLYSEC